MNHGDRITLISKWKLKGGCPEILQRELESLAEKVMAEQNTLMYLVHLQSCNPLQSDQKVNPEKAEITPDEQYEVVFFEMYRDAQAFSDHVTGPSFTSFRKNFIQYFYRDPANPEWPVTENTYLTRESGFIRPEAGMLSPYEAADCVTDNQVIFHEIISENPSALVSGFYQQLFNWEFVESSEGPGTPAGSFWYIKNEGQFMGGIAQQKGGDPAYQKMVSFYVQVDDVDAALDTAKSLGGEIVMAKASIPFQGTTFTLGMFSDPQGNVIGVMEPITAQEWAR